MRHFDAVVIGAGLNGLAASVVLARRGRSVCLVESRRTVGGVAAREVFHPGYTLPGLLHGSVGMCPRVLRQLGLGPELAAGPARAPRWVLTPGEGALAIHRDPEAMKDVLGTKPSDLEAYRAYRAFISRACTVLTPLWSRPAPSTRTTWPWLAAAARLRKLGGASMMELMRALPMSAKDFLDERLMSEPLKAGLAAPALAGWFGGPRAPGGAAQLILAECAAEADAVQAAALGDALAARCEAFGVCVRTSASVSEVHVDGGRVAGVTVDDEDLIRATTVIACCAPQSLWSHLLPEGAGSSAVASRVRAIRARGASAHVAFALDAPPEFHGLPGRVSELQVGASLEAVERAFDPVKYGEVADAPTLDVRVPTVDAPDLAPEGHEVLSVWARAVPYNLCGGWTEARREALADLVMQRLEARAPGLASRVVARRVLTPLDLEQRYGLPGGHVDHVEPAFDQILSMRPTIGLAPSVPALSGLFLGGRGCHPGGFALCSSGVWAAEAALGERP